MTPKEEAEDLYNKMFISSTIKEYALIAVNKILHYAKAHGFIELTNYYEEVKQEIEKL